MWTLLFVLFSTLAVVGAGAVLVAPHPVHSVLYLVLVFCNGAALLLLLEADVLALLFLVVYVGAIAVLFLFVVMMLDLKSRPLSAPQVLPLVPAAALLGVVFLGELLLVVRRPSLRGGASSSPTSLGQEYFSWRREVDALEPLQPLGQVLYTHYLLAFLLGGLVLLLALVGAIVLTLPVRTPLGDRTSGAHPAKRQHLMHQLSRREDGGRFLLSLGERGGP